MMRPARVRIAHQNLLHNARIIRELAPRCSLMAVVKADAYGHGASSCTTVLQDMADTFAVATVSEARALLETLAPEFPDLTVLHGADCADDLNFALQHGLSLVLHDSHQLTLWEESRDSPKRPMRLWLKINTGMNRLGVNPDQAMSACQRMAALGWSEQPLGLMTHLACADEPDGAAFTHAQLEQFDAVCEQLRRAAPEIPQVYSVAASAGILNYPESHRDWIRPGLMLYGVSPGPEPKDVDLRPVMTLEAPVLSIRDCQAGEHIGYGATYTCPTAMRIGLLEAGYADGYPRAAGGRTEVLAGQQRCRTLGRVSMDLIAIDLSGTSVNVGDWVELWGEHIRVEEVAAKCGIIAYEVLCNAGHNCRHA